MDTYAIELRYYDYPDCNSSRMDWLPFNNDLMLVSATQEEIDAWLNERNSAIVARQIQEYEEEIKSKERTIESLEEKIKLIDEMGEATSSILELKKPHDGAIPRCREEIAKLRNKITDLETAELEKILRYGLVNRKWLAEKIEIEKLEDLNNRGEY
ncbi:hypothetical protein AU106_gp138 [Sinorhizobium phage phiM9]|uniref:Uncharacterized protein n=1 Tax=Sinorhizobium phage phiM9 TaxID=1636182 RepID=A0A0F6THJ3_9CAUD|nr:hypothetical protein AU106_gp138 [Sinorhizobium phage phiM9]AKE44769.1 hypothetical protein Sm_phiM9_141 [Sinorhizobium phage phiM9]